jgi:hypothetical protein
MKGEGGRSLSCRDFCSRRRDTELVAGPHFGVDGRRQGSPVAAAASGRARTSPIPGPLIGGAAVSLN